MAKAKAATKKAEEQKPSIEQLSALLTGENKAEAPQTIERQTIKTATVKGARLYFAPTKTGHFGVNLYKAAEAESFSAKMLHDDCMSPLKQNPMHCPACNKDVEKANILKGYATEDGTFVIVSDEEKKNCQVRGEKRIDIEMYVPAEQVDAMYFAQTEFMCPEDGTLNKSMFKVLRDSMVRKGVVAIASLNLKGREETVCLRPVMQDGKAGLAVHYLFFQNEVRVCDKWDSGTLNEAEQKLAPVADQIIDSMVDDFQPEKFFDSYTQNLKKLIAAKAEGKELPKVAVAAAAPAAADPMAALLDALNSPEVAQKKANSKRAKKVAA